MPTTAIYIPNRITFWERLQNTVEIIGYSRAASELARLGYHKEAKECMMQIKRIRG